MNTFTKTPALIILEKNSKSGDGVPAFSGSTEDGNRRLEELTSQYNAIDRVKNDPAGLANVQKTYQLPKDFVNTMLRVINEGGGTFKVLPMSLLDARYLVSLDKTFCRTIHHRMMKDRLDRETFKSLLA